jgi:EAL domain-containing protein (putative c-di-GMP-specific phosphodiesterase class I)
MSSEADDAPKRLLIFDDDEAVGKTLGHIARRMGVDAQIVTHPKAFLQRLETWQPTHIALDLVMPEMDGVQVLRLLAERQCRAMIIITSGVGSRVLDAAQRAAEESDLNIAGILPKPFNPATVKELLDKKPSPSKTARAMPAAGEITIEAIRRGLEQREFELAYQPKINCATGRLTGFEALVRWRDPTVGLIMPDQFISLVEDSSLIDELTNQVCNIALRWLASSQSRPELTMSVNISVRNLRDIYLAERLSDLCGELDLDPDRVILELTETSAMDEAATSLALLTRLRMRRFHLSIDDFGTGYSSMIQLVRLPFSEMKVDRSFVMNAAKSEESRTVIKSIVDLGHGLGLTVTAEGVEDAQTLTYLKEIGCDLAQGYYIARPMPADQALLYVNARQPPPNSANFAEILRTATPSFHRTPS